MAKAPKQAPAAEAPPEPVLNEHGEIILHLEGTPYVLRPSFKAIDAIEQRLRPLPQLAMDAERQGLSLRDMAMVTAELLRAYALANPGEPGVIANPDVERLMELIVDAGMLQVMARLMVVLGGAVTGGYTPTGEPKAGTATT